MIAGVDYPEPKTIERIGVPGYPGVEVDAYARVWVNGIEKTGWLNFDGYFVFHVGFGKNKKQERRSRLICSAFHGADYGGKIVAHKNDIKIDDRPENLYWATYSENLSDAYKNGRHKVSCSGGSNGRSKLSEDCVILIREMAASGEWSQKELAEMFGISASVVSSIVKRRTWRHI
jgi:hypothetical protein